MQVYPAASIIGNASNFVPIYYIDPNPADVAICNEVIFIKEKATVGFEKIKEEIISLS